jgi:hypothetical protein
MAGTPPGRLEIYAFDPHTKMFRVQCRIGRQENASQPLAFILFNITPAELDAIIAQFQSMAKRPEKYCPTCEKPIEGHS